MRIKHKKFHIYYQEYKKVIKLGKKELHAVRISIKYHKKVIFGKEIYMYSMFCFLWHFFNLDCIYIKTHNLSEILALYCNLLKLHIFEKMLFFTVQ